MKTPKNATAELSETQRDAAPRYTRVLIEGHDGFVEKVWVEIYEGTQTDGKGFLANQPLSDSDLKLGHLITYATTNPKEWPWLVRTKVDPFETLLDSKGDTK